MMDFGIIIIKTILAAATGILIKAGSWKVKNPPRLQYYYRAMLFIASVIKIFKNYRKTCQPLGIEQLES
jgi:hypothetical protein